MKTITKKILFPAVIFCTMLSAASFAQSISVAPAPPAPSAQFSPLAIMGGYAYQVSIMEFYITQYDSNDPAGQQAISDIQSFIVILQAKADEHFQTMSQSDQADWPTQQSQLIAPQVLHSVQDFQALTQNERETVLLEFAAKINMELANRAANPKG